MIETLPAPLPAPQDGQTKPAITLQEVPQTTPLRPLPAGDSRYVDLSAGQQSLHLAEMRQYLEDIALSPVSPVDDRDYAKVIFSGHRGSGKTTELKLIEREFADRFYCIHLSMDDQNLMADFDYTIFLLWLCEQLVDCFASDGMPLDEERVQEVARWFVERTETEVDERALAGALQVDGEASAGGALFGFGLKLFGRVKTEAKGSQTRRVEISRRLRSYATDLIEKVNQLLDEARFRLEQSGRPPRLLVVQDNLDKLDGEVARGFFADTSGLLRQVQAHVIFTAPVAEALTPFKIENVFSESFHMPMIKSCTQEGAAFGPGIAVLHQLVERRIDPSLFVDEGLIDRLCFASGGNVRDLVRLAGQAARLARTLKRPKIDADCVEEAVKTIRLEYERTLAPGARTYYPFLAGIHRTKLYGDGPGDPVVTLRALLDNSAILVYQNGDNWYDVHPTIRESKAFRKALADLDTP